MSPPERQPAIRVALPADVPAIQGMVERELYLADVADFTWHLPEVVAAAVAARRYAVAEVDGALAGILALEVHRGELWIDVIAVDPAHRGKGVARALVEVAIRAARAKRAPSLAVSTYRQYGVEAFYERMGFRIVDRDEGCTWLLLDLR